MPMSLAAAPVDPPAPPSATWRNTVGGLDVVFGAGAVRRLGDLIRECGAGRALLVTDPGVRRGCDVDGIVDELGEGIEAAVFDGVDENPTTDHVEAGVEVAREHRAELLVGFGGGSAMDCAKGINFLVTNGGRMEDYWGADEAASPMLPAIGIPTTAGTGSEAQRFALISQAGTHRKMACGDLKARFRSVILDPELTASTPRAVTVTAGADAIAHAVESYVTRARTPISRMHARESWELLSDAYPRVLEDPGSVGVRGRMLVGAHLAGAAIECSMLGAAHACANPLTARHDIPHGMAVALMLPAVVRYNAAAVDGLYAELVEVAAAAIGGSGSGPAGGESLARLLEELWRQADLPVGLAALGIDRAELEGLARSADDEWTAGFNPRAVDADALLTIYHDAWKPGISRRTASPTSSTGAAPESV